MLEVNPIAPTRNLPSLRRGIIIVGFVIGMLVIATAIIISFKLRQQAIESGIRELAAVSRITAERTSQTFLAADLLTRTIQDAVLKPALSDEAELRTRVTTRKFYDDLVNLQKLLPQSDVAAVADSNAKLLADTRLFPAPNMVINNDILSKELKEGFEQGLVISDPEFNELNQQWMIYLRRPLRDVKESFVGFVEVGIPSSYFEGYLSIVDIGADTALTIVTHNLKVIARWPHLDRDIGMMLPVAAPVNTTISGGTPVSFLRGLDGRMRLVARSRFEVNDIEFYLSIAQTFDALLSHWQKEIIWIFFFASISLLVLAALTFLILRTIHQEESWSAAVVEREIRLSRQAGELVLARDAAESANRVRGEFLANMSHELRTPLNAVLGFSEILHKELFGPLGDERYKEFAADIHSSGKHLLDIIGNILDLTKIDAGKLELNEEDLDIIDLMKNCGRLVADSARSAGVRFQISLPEHSVVLRGDPIRLKQILFNLLSNAVKFTPSDHDVILSGEVADDGFILRVSDTGIGMTEDEAIQSMQAFRQIDSSFSRRYQGTGLGLPLTKSLVDLHGGILTIDSEKGKGSTFTVLLPRWRLERVNRSDAC